MFQKSISSLSVLFFSAILLITCQNEKKYVGTQKNSKIFSVEDPHSYSNPSKIRVTHMDLNLEILWSTHILKGFVTVTLDKNENADTLILDTRQLKISAVQNISGKALN